MLIPKVLLVNDDPATLLALDALLRDVAKTVGFEVLGVSSGEEALRQVLKHDFAVILLDVNMPIMDGFETAEAIHSHPRSASVPIIFVTAYYGDEVNRLKGYQKGAVDYLFTPVIPQVLQTKVSVFVELAKQRIELEKLNHDMRSEQLQELQRINVALEAEILVRREAELRAHELATKDALTKLPNRRSLIERLDHAIANASRHKKRLAVLFLDLDKFKTINDTFGHEAGDELLVTVAARIVGAVRESDTVSRLGGDEFVVLLEGLSDGGDAAKTARKIADAIAPVYKIGKHGIRTSASIGISLYPLDGTSAQLLLKHADQAMYQAKSQGNGGICFFNDEANAALSGTDLK